MEQTRRISALLGHVLDVQTVVPLNGVLLHQFHSRLLFQNTRHDLCQ